MKGILLLIYSIYTIRNENVKCGIQLLVVQIDNNLLALNAKATLKLGIHLYTFKLQ